MLVADFVSDVGTFLQGVGAAWLMTSLTSRPVYIALIQTASALPFFLLALPAGSIGDICDRRKLILGTELWMVGIAIVLAATTITHTMTPWLLLVLTFGLSAGDAIESPSWRAIFPELVPKEELAPALALNGIEFNLARAVGPGLGGVIIAIAGVGIAFILNILSFVGVIWVIAGWKRPVRKSRLPVETLAGATRAALRHVRYSPDILKLLVRSACVIFFASAFWALLPAVAKNFNGQFAGIWFAAWLFWSRRSRRRDRIAARKGLVLIGKYGVGSYGCFCCGHVRDRSPARTVVTLHPEFLRRRGVDRLHVDFQYPYSETSA
jgi:MFS family permease